MVLALATVAVLVCAPFFGAQPPEVAAQSAPPSSGAGATSADGALGQRYFEETGFRIADDRFAQYFAGRGGVATFGYPTSRRFFLLNSQVQFFQRHVMQLHGNGRVGLLNLLDAEFLPYTQFGDVTVPPASPDLSPLAPVPGSPTYADDASLFIASTVPNSWGGMSVGFLDAFLAPGRAAGATDPLMQVLIGVELYGFPTSRPASDPTNDGFVYQRFQRTVLHYDVLTGKAQPMLLADYLKALLTGRGLTPGLQAQASAAGSPHLNQYNPARPFWVLRPELLPGSDLSSAFELDDPSSPPPAGSGVGASPQLPLLLPGVTAPGAGSGLSGTTTGIPGPGMSAATLTPAASALTAATPVSVQPSPTMTPTPLSAVPVIERTEPGSVRVGGDVTLRGQNFGSQAGHVLFTGKLTTAQIWSDTHIIVTVPEGATDGTVRIRRPDGVFSNEVGFAPAPTPTSPATDPTPAPTFTPTATPGVPAISTLSPQNGPPNSTMLVQGNHFGEIAGQVLFGNSEAPVQSSGWSNSSIVARVPSDVGPGAARVSVRRGTDGQLSGFKCYQVVAATPTAPAGATPTPGATPTTAPTPTTTTSC